MPINSITTNQNKTNETRATYGAREFTDLKMSLIQYAKQYFPNTYKDFNDASPGMMFIEMSAYVGDVLNFYAQGFDGDLIDVVVQNAGPSSAELHITPTPNLNGETNILPSKTNPIIPSKYPPPILHSQTVLNNNICK